MLMSLALMKAFEYITKQLQMNDFELLTSGWHLDSKATMWFDIKGDLSKTRIQTGPPKRSRIHAANFRKKHKKVHEKSGILYAEIKRKHTAAETFIKELLRDKYLKDKVSSIRIIKILK